jgi:hypothetical protein
MTQVVPGDAFHNISIYFDPDCKTAEKWRKVGRRERGLKEDRTSNSLELFISNSLFCRKLRSVLRFSSSEDTLAAYRSQEM